MYQFSFKALSNELSARGRWISLAQRVSGVFHVHTVFGDFVQSRHKILKLFLSDWNWARIGIVTTVRPQGFARNKIPLFCEFILISVPVVSRSQWMFNFFNPVICLSKLVLEQSSLKRNKSLNMVLIYEFIWLNILWWTAESFRNHSWGCILIVDQSKLSHNFSF